MLSQLRAKASIGLKLATDRRYREFYAQRRIEDISAREDAAARIAKLLPRSNNFSADPEAADQLKQDGFVPLPDLISIQQVSELRAYFADLPAHDPYRPELGNFRAPQDVPPQTHVSHYSDEAIVSAPHIFKIANDARVLSIVENFLGCKPTLAAIRVWWSTPSTSREPEHAENFHRDIDDLRFIKLFIYLTDVDEYSGPHIYATGSHRKNVLTSVGRFPDQEVEAAVGKDSIVQFTGPAGTCFLENTFGLHRGLPPTKQARLILQPLFALRPIIFGPRRPLRRFRADEATLDRYINRVFLFD